MADHSTVNIQVSFISCGVLEISSITDPERAVFQLAGRLYHPSRGAPAACFMISDINEENSTSKFIKLMEKFAWVQKSEPVENPKTGNIIYIATGNFEHAKFKKWYSEERIRRLQKVGT